MKRSTIPSLDDLRAFEATARLGSVRSAADDLALTHGAVSRRITKLSGDIGTSLFVRDGRGLKLTAEGEALFRTTSRFFAELEETIREIAEPKQKDATAVVLSCERSVAMRWLIPRLSRFQDTYPEIAVHLSVGGGPLDFGRNPVSLALRRLDFPIPDTCQVEHLFPERVGPVVAPQLQSSFEEGNYLGLGSKTRPDAWKDWLAKNPDCERPKEIRYHDHHFLMVEAASSNLGVALSPEVLAIDDIERKRLVAPLGFIEDGTHYGLIFPKDMVLNESAEHLIDWLRELYGVRQSSSDT
ncbi:LysR family transcriptional regulator [Ruegeria sp. HKCCD8929]|uniref:LysR family transcriptional regulator n=1 Tax=Ruegeria sp. HKCCD8929 TaxID=2683006 RepID=UPI001488E66D|nr:LysR family transcriptional regulator [Ruegeria sp. HKCCD8929]